MKPIHLSGFNTLTFLFSALAFLPSGYSGAEQIMDSADTLVVAERSAFDRVKNGYFLDALSAEQNALQTMENRLGPTHPALVPVLTDLATIDRYLARYAEAEAALQWARALREKALGAGDPRVGETCGQLAALYDDWGKWEDAEFWGEKSLASLEKQPIGAGPGLCEALNRLGRIELNRGQAGQARALFEKSLQLQEKGGTGPAPRIETLDFLAKIDEREKRLSDAESRLRQADEIAAKSFTDHSVEVADAKERLADFYRSQGRLEKARPLYRSALKIYRGFVGTYFGYTNLAYLQKLARAYQSAGDGKSALELLEKDLKVTQDTFGPGHPQTAVALLRLGTVEKNLGEDKAAEGHFKDALTVLKSFFPEGHPLILRAEALLKP